MGGKPLLGSRAVSKCRTRPSRLGRGFSSSTGPRARARSHTDATQLQRRGRLPLQLSHQLRAQRPGLSSSSSGTCCGTHHPRAGASTVTPSPSCTRSRVRLGGMVPPGQVTPGTLVIPLRALLPHPSQRSQPMGPQPCFLNQAPRGQGDLGCWKSRLVP